MSQLVLRLFIPPESQNLTLLSAMAFLSCHSCRSTQGAVLIDVAPHQLVLLKLLSCRIPLHGKKQTFKERNKVIIEYSC